MSKATQDKMKTSRAKRLGIVGGLALLVGGAGLAPLVTSGGAAESTEDEAPETTNAETELASVTRGDLIEETEGNGTVGFGDTATLPIDGDGLVTRTRESGEIVNSGDELLRIADRPVFLVEGSQPLYRELRRVSSSERDAAGDKIGLQEGADVEQLQRFLIAAGFDDKGRLEVDGTFGLTTQRAVKDWQRSVGHPATGKVDRGQIVFAPGAVRVETAPSVGEAFSEVTVTAGSPRISLTVKANQRSFYEIGASVEIESAGASATGTVVDQKRTIGDDGSTGYRIDIKLDAGEDLGNAEAVKVTAKNVKASGVLTVPVRALIALAEGGWAVQVDTPSGVQLTAVELGDVVEGTAEITGVDEGASVVVPV